MTFDECNTMIFDLMTALQTLPQHEQEKYVIYQAVQKAGQNAFSDDLAQPIVMPSRVTT